MTAASSGGPAAGAPEAVRRLDALVGRWASSGEMVDPERWSRNQPAASHSYSSVPATDVRAPVMSAAWERLVAGRGWVDWMEMRFERLAAG